MARPRPRSLRRALGAAAALAGCVVAALQALPPAAAQEDQPAPLVRVVELDGPVTGVLVDHVTRIVEDAALAGDEAVVVRLNTPGGLVVQTERLTTTFLEARVPVIVWVGPRGAQATSAGTFITLSAHFAAMAPDTTIGAASPVDGAGGDLPETLKAKTTGVLVARMENLAARRGPEAVAFAVQAVEDATTITAREALEIGVVDVIAESVETLLEDLDGREVSLADRVDVLQTADARIQNESFNLLERGLAALSNPTIAYILLLLGLGGIVYELVVPGVGFAGIVGGIALLLGVYALGMLPVNYVGVALVLLAFVLFVADVKAGTGGLVALAGVASLVLGGLLLFDSPHFGVSVVVLVTSAIALGLFFVFAGRAALAIHKRTATTGVEGLVGALGEVREDLDPSGLVVVQGETWRATAADAPLARGTRVRVTAMDGLRIRVERAE